MREASASTVRVLLARPPGPSDKCAGPRCRHKHVRKLLCEAYMIGFCPDGPLCKYGHPKYELPKGSEGDMSNPRRNRMPVVCHKCGVAGHKAANCPETQRVRRRPLLSLVPCWGRESAHVHPVQLETLGTQRGPPRPLETVTCFKCGQLGHYANKVRVPHSRG